VVLAQALIASVSLYTLSAVRAYVGGESYWSKGQKEAVYFLHMYADTGLSRYYGKYRAAIAVPLADREARLALESPDLDYDKAAQGFLGGNNSLDDVKGLIWLYRNFRDVSYLSRAIDRWIESDPQLLRLAALGETMHARFSEGSADPADISRWKEDIHDINEKITPLTAAFAQSLGEGSRAIADLLLAANILTACMLIALAIWRTGKLLAQRTSFETALNAERERAQITLASIGDAVLTANAEGRVDYMNKAAESLLDCSWNDARGKRLNELFRLVLEKSGEEDDQIVQRILHGEAIEASARAQRLVRPDMSAVSVSLVGAPLHVDGAVVGAVLVFHDMTKEQEYVAQLSWQASHDALTALANRREFERRLEASLSSLRERQSVHALMYLDLDQFKLVNDTCGHAAGDDLLRKVSAALAQQLRPADLLARLGGDEFGVLMENSPPDVAAAMAERLRRAVHGLNFVWNGRPFGVSVSIGLVSLSDSDTTMEETLRGVDVACYLAKEKGRNRVQLHQATDSEMIRRVDEMAWVHRLREALDRDHFRLYAQEIAPLSDDGEDGAHIEILLRLSEADGTLVLPGSFIPAAERYDLMPLIDRWVVRNTFDTLAALAREGRSAPIATCAINLSGASLGDRAFVEFIGEQFDRTGIAPSTICFEITETSAIADLSSAAHFIGALQSVGCRFSLDDFGSGMSSFGYLKHLKVDYLKIDGGFVKDMLEDRIDRAMVEMIHHIGKVTGKKTIAEFVESKEIADALRDIGVDYAQGYAIARPAPFVAPFGSSVIADPVAVATPARQATARRRRAG